MIPVMQKEINTFIDVVWNTHRIREQKNTFLPDGVPNHIYNFPEQYGLEQCGMSFCLFVCFTRFLVFQYNNKKNIFLEVLLLNLE